MKAVCFLPCFSTLYSVLYIQCSIVISFQRLIADGPFNSFSLLFTEMLQQQISHRCAAAASCVVFCHTILHSILRSYAFPHNLASFLFLRPLQLPYFARESLRFQFSGFTMTGGLFFSSLPFSMNGILCISAQNITLLQTLAPWIGMWTHLTLAM